jgi:predicted peptidase
MRSQIKLLPLESGNNVITIVKDDSKLKVNSVDIGSKIIYSEISNYLKYQHLVVPQEVASAYWPINDDMRVYQPIDQASTPKGHQYPLIVFLHGAGGRRETGFEKKKWVTPMKNLMNQNTYRFKIFAPHFVDPDVEVWQVDKLNKWLDHMLAYSYDVDETRIYLNGHSLGGYGTWKWGNANKERFAALLPSGYRLTTSYVNNLLEVPVKAFKGEADSIAYGMEDTIQLMNDRGAVDASIIIKPDGGHSQTWHWNNYLDEICTFMLNYNNQR